MSRNCRKRHEDIVEPFTAQHPSQDKPCFAISTFLVNRQQLACIRICSSCSVTERRSTAIDDRARDVLVNFFMRGRMPLSQKMMQNRTAARGMNNNGQIKRHTRERNSNRIVVRCGVPLQITSFPTPRFRPTDCHHAHRHTRTRTLDRESTEAKR